MLRAVVIAFSTYSKIPMPRVSWEEKGMRYSLCFFPLVGAVIGGCCVLCFYGLLALDMGKNAVAAVLTALPILLNGGIHMDGFLDTVDAKSSWKPKEEKLKILKDPHTGAFAVIYGIIYLILMFGLFGEITEKKIGCMAVGYAYERILSALSLVTLRKAKKDGMAAASADAAAKNVKWILGGELVLCILCFFAVDPVYGAVCILAGGISFCYYRNMAYRYFGGITGDLAGYFLQVCEIFMLFCLVMVQKL